jgi:hypothetical protein
MLKIFSFNMRGKLKIVKRRLGGWMVLRRYKIPITQDLQI